MTVATMIATADEASQFGRTTASKSEATFTVLLLSMTSDPDLIAAAERGRREALAMAGSVCIVHRSHYATVARVRDDAGIHDVSYGAATGWSCSCDGVDDRCAHVLALRQTLEAKDPRS